MTPLSVRAFGALASATLLAIAMIPSWRLAPSAYASSDSVALNGSYRATSDGSQAQTNYAFHDEESVTSMWTITSMCNNPVDCTGQVSSDQGWSATLRLLGGDMWIVAHDVPNWEHCQDGTAAPGHQTFKFTANENLSGWDSTVGPSGACGANKWLVITMPFKLVKID
jgi:hypothetical protein